MTCLEFNKGGPRGEVIIELYISHPSSAKLEAKVRQQLRRPIIGRLPCIEVTQNTAGPHKRYHATLAWRIACYLYVGQAENLLRLTAES